MSQGPDPRSKSDPVDQAGTPQPVPPPAVIWIIVVLGLVMLAAAAWAVFG